MSSFVWIDHSEKQRRQVLQAIDEFREKDTRDELGLANIRDGIAETLFPGTGTQQTRAKYFFFVPWTVRRHAEGRTKAGDVARRIREEELRLIDVLAESETPRPKGIIGIDARKALQRCPSSIYWNGLKALRICTSPYSLGDYLRHAERNKKSEPTLLDDDRNAVLGSGSVWPSQLPKAPAGFPEGARIDLTGEEADFLKKQVIAQRPDSLFTFFLQEDIGNSDVPFAWNHEATDHAPLSLNRKISNARIFAEVMEGAPIIYNLSLAAHFEPMRPMTIEKCENLLNEWRDLLAARQLAIDGFAFDDFWTFVHECGVRPSEPTRLFVERWFSIADTVAKRAALLDNSSARDLVFAREQEIKGQMARSLSHNLRGREMWNGEAGLGRLEYRWATSQTYLNDIAKGLKQGAHA